VINAETMYFSSNLKYVPAKNTVDNTIAINTAIPPSTGVELVCDVRPLGWAQRLFNLETVTIDGMVSHVIANAITNPGMISIHGGIDIEDMLKGKVKI